MNKPNTFVIGGTGYLGRYIVDSLLARGHKVTVLSRSKQRASKVFGRKVAVREGDVHGLTSNDWLRLLRGQQNLVFAAGVDERVPPEGDPLAFYRHENVTLVQPILDAAGQVGIERVALLNSVFSTLDRLRPELELPKYHPYIQARIEQRDMALDAARKGKFIMTVLEIPWVFGDARDAESQWAPLVNYIRTTPRLFVLNGGTVVISARNVGEAAAGAVESPKRSSVTPVGDQWMTWESLMTTLARACGREDVPLMHVPDKLVVQFNELSGLGQKLFRVKSGLDYGRMHQFLLDDKPVKLAASQKKLGYSPDDIGQALAETAANVPESKAVAALRKLMS